MLLALNILNIAHPGNRRCIGKSPRFFFNALLVVADQGSDKVLQYVYL